MDRYGIDETDAQLREIYDRNSPSFDEADFAARLRRRTSTSRKRVSAPRRRSGLRIAAVAFASLVLLAGVGTGIYEALTYLGQSSPTVVSEPGIVIGDQTTETSAPDQTTQTTPGKLPSGTWLRLPLLAKGETIHTISIWALVMDPSDSSILYATTSEGLFKSSDGAGSWNQLPTSPGDVGALFIDPTSPSTLYVVYATAPETNEAVPDHLLRSDDGGLTWTDLTEAGAPRKGGDIWVATAFDTTTTPSTIYMWDDTGYVWRSTDRGTTWTKLSFDEGMQAFEHADSPRETPPIPPAAQQALDAFRASSGDQVYLTDADTGAVVGPIDAYGPGAILIDPDHLSTFCAATGDGVYRSIDSGRTWRKASTGLPDVTDPADAAVWSVLVDPNRPSTLYATTSAGIHRSTDGGTEWTLILEGGGASVVLAPSIPTRLYASSGELLRSDDGGTNWTRLTNPKGSDVCFSSVVLAIADQPDTVLAFAEEVYWGPFFLYRSTDAGNTWQRTDLGAGFTETIPFVVEDPQHPSIIYLCGTTEDSAHHVFKSTDAGATWTDLATPRKWGASIVSLAVDPHNPETIWAVQDAGADLSGNWQSIIRRSTDGGATWENIELDALEEWTTSLAFDPQLPNTLYAWTGRTVFDRGAIRRSTDGGATWENIGGNIMPEFNQGGQWVVLVPDPAPGGALYAATQGGLFKWVPRGD